MLAINASINFVFYIVHIEKFRDSFIQVKTSDAWMYIKNQLYNLLSGIDI